MIKFNLFWAQKFSKILDVDIVFLGHSVYFLTFSGYTVLKADIIKQLVNFYTNINIIYFLFQIKPVNNICSGFTKQYIFSAKINQSFSKTT